MRVQEVRAAFANDQQSDEVDGTLNGRIFEEILLRPTKFKTDVSVNTHFIKIKNAHEGRRPHFRLHHLALQHPLFQHRSQLFAFAGAKARPKMST